MNFANDLERQIWQRWTVTHASTAMIAKAMTLSPNSPNMTEADVERIIRHLRDQEHGRPDSK